MQSVSIFLCVFGALALAEAAVVDLLRQKRSPHSPGYSSHGFQQQPIGFPGGYNGNRPGQGFGSRPGGFNKPGFNQQFVPQQPGLIGPNRQPSISGSQSSSNSQSFNGGGLSSSQSSSSSQSFSSGGRGGLSGSSSQSSSSSNSGGGLGGGRRPAIHGGGSGSQSSSSSNSFSG